MSANLGVGVLILIVGFLAMLLYKVDLMSIFLVSWGLSIVLRSTLKVTGVEA